ncbi:MAG TPA: pre-peptidase C-terminal domain-containing protein, partial [Aggregatilineales bacterium]|nr:pre-peptidase C-terminal domain-containing protein [Aggregatilineales bacterium]
IALRTVRGDAPPVGFQLESPDGKIIRAGADRNTSAGAREEDIVLPDTGIYYLFVGAIDATFQGESVYELSVELQNQLGSRSSGSLIPYDLTHQGTLFADDPSDIWVFEGVKGEVISITVEGDGFLEPGLALLGFDNTTPLEPILSRTGTIEDPAHLNRFELGESGPYGIQVTGINSTTGHYTLRVSRITDSTQASELLENGREYTDSIESNGVRFWQFSGSEGDIVSLTLQRPARSNLLPHLTFFAPDGTALLTSSNRFEGATLQTIPFELPVGGTYQVEISTLLAGDSVNDGGAYTLVLNQQPAAEISTLRPIFYGEPGINALSEDNRSDFWIFDGEAGDVVHISGEATSGNLDTALRILDPGGVEIADADDSADSLDAEITLVLPTDGQYTLEIAPFGREQVQAITSGNYRLSINLLYRPAAIPETENRLLTYGERIVDTIDPVQNNQVPVIDEFFVGQHGDRINITLQFPAGEFPLLLFLEDGAGNRYRQGERIQDRVLIRDFELPSDGIYRIIIQRPLDGRTDVYYPYTLSLSLRAAEAATQTTGGFLTRGVSQGATFESDSPTHSWIYNGQAGENIAITLLRLTGQNYPGLTVYTPDNRVLLNHTAGEIAQTRSISLTLPTDGFYQIAVINDIQEPFLSYRLAVNSGDVTQFSSILHPGVADSGILSDTTSEAIWNFEGHAGTPVYARART